jgi:hypothetical protein
MIPQAQQRAGPAVPQARPSAAFRGAKSPQFAPISGVTIAQSSGRNMDEATVRACREQAHRYRELARSAMTPELARTFADLADSWTVMADEIERALEREHDGA